jgi:hypothetical protein
MDRELRLFNDGSPRDRFFGTNFPGSTTRSWNGVGAATQGNLLDLEYREIKGCRHSSGNMIRGDDFADTKSQCTLVGALPDTFPMMPRTYCSPRIPN